MLRQSFTLILAVICVTPLLAQSDFSDDPTAFSTVVCPGYDGSNATLAFEELPSSTSNLLLYDSGTPTPTMVMHGDGFSNVDVGLATITIDQSVIITPGNSFNTVVLGFTNGVGGEVTIRDAGGNVIDVVDVFVAPTEDVVLWHAGNTVPATLEVTATVAPISLLAFEFFQCNYNPTPSTLDVVGDIASDLSAMLPSVSGANAVRIQQAIDAIDDMSDTSLWDASGNTIVDGGAVLGSAFSAVRWLSSIRGSGRNDANVIVDRIVATLLDSIRLQIDQSAAAGGHPGLLNIATGMANFAASLHNRNRELRAVRFLYAAWYFADRS